MSGKLAFAILAASTLLLAGCASKNTTGAGGSKPITMKDDFFEPVTYDAASGELVKWKNVGKGTHTVTVQKPGGGKGEYLYNKELIGPAGTAEFTFPGPGTYDVFCIYHSQGAAGDFSGGMVMKVVVA